MAKQAVEKSLLDVLSPSVRSPLPSSNPVECDFSLFVVADDGCAEFRLASCGQDSLLKIWMVSQREGAGRWVLTPAAPSVSGADSLDD